LHVRGHGGERREARPDEVLLAGLDIPRPEVVGGGDERLLLHAGNRTVHAADVSIGAPQQLGREVGAQARYVGRTSESRQTLRPLSPPTSPHMVTEMAAMALTAASLKGAWGL